MGDASMTDRAVARQLVRQWLAEDALGGSDEAIDQLLEAMEAESDTTALQSALADARAVARILAHAYTTDTRPPADVVAKALAFDV